MIAERYITEWSKIFPWTKNSFVEQDLVICRALVDIFSDPYLSGALAPFDLHNSWYSGSCRIKTYSLDELMGTKLRALYQRKKGRDLFDFNLALPRVDESAVVRVWREYMRFSVGEVPSLKQFEANMDEKMTLNDYLGDVEPLLRGGITFNPHEAYAKFKKMVLPLI